MTKGQILKLHEYEHELEYLKQCKEEFLSSNGDPLEFPTITISGHFEIKVKDNITKRLFFENKQIVTRLLPEGSFDSLLQEYYNNIQKEIEKYETLIEEL